jgi:decaprenylphospho-beta-D-ribofuranose 2-oxidase
VEDLHARLERITLDHGGRLYAAKDALMSATGFARMFPELEAFRAVLRRVDPHGRFQSDMSRRLAIHPNRG